METKLNKILKIAIILILFPTLAYAWGPKQHKRITGDAISMLSKTNAKAFAKYIKDAEAPKYSSYPDLNLPSHGWNMVKDRGNIIGFMAEYYKKLVYELKLNKKNKEEILKDVGCLTHYIADMHTIGQISSEYWGHADDRIDFASELCSFSPIFFDTLRYVGLDSLDSLMHDEIIDTYRVWRPLGNYARQVFFVSPWQVKSYVDRQGQRSVYFAELALYNAWVDAGHPTNFKQTTKKKCRWWMRWLGFC